MLLSKGTALFIALALLSAWTVDSQDRKLACSCSDVDPRFGKDKHLKYIRYRCLEHRDRNECDSGFMFNTVKELPEGFCQITCGRCNCCKTLRSLAKELDLTDWIWAMEKTQLDSILDNPGIEVSALVPRNGALDELLIKLGGWSRNEIGSDDRKQSILSEVLKFNMISAIPNHWAVYSSPFFKEGMQVATELDPVNLITIREWGGGNIGFEGNHNSATLNSNDVDKETCKGYIQITDQFLLPFGDSSNRAKTEQRSKSEAQPVPQEAACQIAENTVYGGELLNTVKADHTQACCSACNKKRRCNTWSFCASERGCQGSESGEGVWWGDCQLKHSPEVQQGSNPPVIENDAMTPYSSGHLLASVESLVDNQG